LEYIADIKSMDNKKSRAIAGPADDVRYSCYSNLTELTVLQWIKPQLNYICPTIHLISFPQDIDKICDIENPCLWWVCPTFRSYLYSSFWASPLPPFHAFI
jgi:hypothetical protein